MFFDLFYLFGIDYIVIGNMMICDLIFKDFFGEFIEYLVFMF